MFYIPLDTKQVISETFLPTNHWLNTEGTKPKTTRKQCENKTALVISETKATERLNLNINQQSTVRTAHMCVHITVHNCSTQYSTE